MTEPPRRKRFQIHLSTAIVLMFVAGGLIWLNCLPTRGFGVRLQPWAFTDGMDEADGPYISWSFRHGWPQSAVWTGKTMDKTNRWLNRKEDNRILWFFKPVAIDCLVAVAILFAVWFLCEWLIRRRAARKGA